MTEMERQQVTDFFTKGYTIKDIMLIMPFSRDEIKEVIEQHKGQARESKANIKYALMADDVKNGETNVYALAEKYNVSVRSVYRYCKVGHKKPHYNSKSALIVAELQKGELSQAEIARQYGTTRQAVNRCKKYL